MGNPYHYGDANFNDWNLSLHELVIRNITAKIDKEIADVLGRDVKAILLEAYSQLAIHDGEACFALFFNFDNEDGLSVYYKLSDAMQNMLVQAEDDFYELDDLLAAVDQLEVFCKEFRGRVETLNNARQ